MAAGNTPVNRTVNVYINAAQAERTLTNLEKTQKKLTDAIEEGQKAGKDMTSEMNKLDETNKKAERLRGIMEGKIAPSINMVRKEVKKLNAELNEMSKDDAGFEAKQRQWQEATQHLKEMQAEVKKVGSAMEAVGGDGGSGTKFWNQVKAIAVGTIVGNTVQAASDKILGYIAGMLTGNAKLSDSLADVQKATGMTADEVSRLNKELGQINTRTANEELRKIAVGLGQMGQAATKEAIANIDKIVVALGDEFGGGADEITKALGILRNNLQDIKTGNFAEDVLHIGNALNVLGAEGLATAPVITDMVTRMAGIAQTFGATSGQIFGVAATFQELGIEAERGSTAFNKLLQKMTTNMAEYAAIAAHAGLSSKEFANLVNTDIVAALLKVSEGAKKAGADNVAFGKILRDLDADGSGAGEVLSKLAQNGDLLREKINLASTALKESGSITDEFNTKNNNLAATLDKIGKRMASAFTNSVISKGLESMAIGFAKLIGAIKETGNSIEEFKKQAALVEDLDRKVTPLIQHIEELQNKSNLSATEQDELKQSINAVAEAIPGAITGFDKYGQALGVNTERAKAFIEINKLVLKEKNRDAIKDTESTIKELDKQQKFAEKRLASFSPEKQRAEWKKWYDPNAVKKMMTEAENEAFINGYIADRMKDINEISSRIKGQKAILAELKGEPMIPQSTTNENTNAENAENEIETLGKLKTKLQELKAVRENIYLSDKKALSDNLKAQKDLEKQIAGLEDKKVAGQKKAENDLAHVREEIIKQTAELEAMAADAEKDGKVHDQQEIARVGEKYRKLTSMAMGHAAEVASLSELQVKELNLLFKKQFEERSTKEYESELQALDNFYNRQRQKVQQSFINQEIDKQTFDQRMRQIDAENAEDRATKTADYAANSVKAANDLEASKTAALQKGVDERNRIINRDNQDKLARSERDVLLTKEGTKARLDAEVQLIKDKYQLQIEAAQGSADQIALIETQRDMEIQDATVRRNNFILGKAQEAVAALMQTWGSFMSYLNQQDQADLERERISSEKKKALLQQQLDSKSISEETYRRKVEELDKSFAAKENALKKKEFNRNKATMLLQAAMNTAMAVSNVWANHAAWPPVAIALSAIAAAIGAAQIPIIAAQKYPEMRDGGLAPDGGVPNGPNHENNGISLIDGQTGNKIGEIEGGEPIISKQTYSKNKRLVDALLWAGKHGNGSLSPGWLSNLPAGLNVQKMMQSVVTSSMMANGGLTASGSPAVVSPGSTGMMQGADHRALVAAMYDVVKQLQQPMRAELAWTSFLNQQKQWDELEKSARLKA